MRKITENIRRVAALTTGRQDWGIMRSTCSALRADARFELQVYVSGMHWDYASGPAVDDPLAQRVDDLAEILRRNRPEALILVGDRSETLAAALAATLERLDKHGIAFRIIRAPGETRTWQLFCNDPNGVEVELDFAETEVAPADWKARCAT